MGRLSKADIEFIQNNADKSAEELAAALNKPNYTKSITKILEERIQKPQESETKPKKKRPKVTPKDYDKVVIRDTENSKGNVHVLTPAASEMADDFRKDMNDKEGEGLARFRGNVTTCR